MYETKITYCGNDYVIKLTRNAQARLDEMQSQLNVELSDLMYDPDIAPFLNESGMNKYQKELAKIEAMKDGTKKDEAMAKFMSEYAPILKKMTALQSNMKEIEAQEVVYVLITSIPKNPTLSRKDFELMCYEMEEKNGLLETELFFEEVKEKVFMEMEVLKKALNDHKAKKTPPTTN